MIRRFVHVLYFFAIGWAGLFGWFIAPYVHEYEIKLVNGPIVGFLATNWATAGDIGNSIAEGQGWFLEFLSVWLGSFEFGWFLIYGCVPLFIVAGLHYIVGPKKADH